MNQYIMKQGLKRFSQSIVSAIKKEMIQLVMMDALDPENPKDTRKKDRRAAMDYLMLLKDKRDGTTKA